jgi:STE24 endopeptidase
MNDASVGFSDSERERARAYHRPLYAAMLADLALAVGVLSALAWSRLGAWLSPGIAPVAAAAVYAAVVVALSTVVRLPLSAWRGWWRERAWGFSTQRFGSWLADGAKGLLINAVLTAAAWTVGVALARALPGWWALPAGALLALSVLLLSFVAPVLLEPVFNKFRPLDDEELAGELRELSVRAGVPVRDVLVADASRRTTKVNAYVSGIGRTRRVVVFDTLLDMAGYAAGEAGSVRPEDRGDVGAAGADPGAVRVVVAHELGHRRNRDVVKLTLLGMAAAAGAVAVVWAVLGTRVAQPQTFPEALLVVVAIELVLLPAGAWFSRRLERAADRASLELTDEPDAFARAHTTLARRNLSELEPARLAYLLLFSHPTAPERLAAGEAWRAAQLVESRP